MLAGCKEAMRSAARARSATRPSSCCRCGRPVLQTLLGRACSSWGRVCAHVLGEVCEVVLHYMVCRECAMGGGGEGGWVGLCGVLVDVLGGGGRYTRGSSRGLK